MLLLNTNHKVFCGMRKLCVKKQEEASTYWSQKTSWPAGARLTSGACAFGCVLAQLPLLEILLGTRGKASETLVEGRGGIIVAI